MAKIDEEKDDLKQEDQPTKRFKNKFANSEDENIDLKKEETKSCD